MSAPVVKCSNCGKVSERTSILPLCPKCMDGLRDYERYCNHGPKDVQINLSKETHNLGFDDFLKI